MVDARWPFRRMSWCAVALFLTAGAACANSVDLGVLSYDVFIPGAPGMPGVDAFDIANFTGAFGLPPDFPVSGNLTLVGATLTLFPLGQPSEVLALGNIGPGYL